MPAPGPTTASALCLVSLVGDSRIQALIGPKRFPHVLAAAYLASLNKSKNRAEEKEKRSGCVVTARKPVEEGFSE